MENKSHDLKITVDQMKNYLNTGLKFELQVDCHEDFSDLEHCSEFQKAFSKGALWEFVGWSDINLPLGDGEFDGELLQYEKGIYKGNYNDSKPLFFRLADLNKFIPELGFVPLIKMVQETHFGDPNEKWFCGEAVRSRSNRKVYNVGYGDHVWEIELGYPPSLRFDYCQKLFEWHFWPFGDEYFKQGLVIDKMNHK